MPINDLKLKEKVRHSAIMANSSLRLFLLYYKSVSDRFEKKLKLISHVKCTILPDKSVSYAHNY